jgi:hypothetical protein
VPRTFNPIKCKKQIIDAGEWRHGSVPQRSFPTYGKGLPTGPKWVWRLVKLTSTKGELLLLIAFRSDKGEFVAYLGKIEGNRTVVFACLEEHATHPGLHCHAPCGEIAGIPAGAFRYPGQVRGPKSDSRHRRSFIWSKEVAWKTALRFYNVSDIPEGALP